MLKKYRIKQDICGGRKLRRQYGKGPGRIVAKGTIVELDAAQQEALKDYIEPYKAKKSKDEAKKESTPKDETEKSKDKAKKAK